MIDSDDRVILVIVMKCSFKCCWCLLYNREPVTYIRNCLTFPQYPSTECSDQECDGSACYKTRRSDNGHVDPMRILLGNE